MSDIEPLLQTELANARGWEFIRRHARNMEPRKDERWKITRKRISKLFGSGFLVAIIGTSLKGKTQMGTDLMVQSILKKRSAEYTTAIGFFMELRSCYGRDSVDREIDIVDSFCSPKFLVIDEFEKRAETDWANQVIFEVINRRLGLQRDTLLLSNLGKEAFYNLVGAPMVSRLSSFGGIIECCWPMFSKEP